MYASLAERDTVGRAAGELIMREPEINQNKTRRETRTMSEKVGHKLSAKWLALSRRAGKALLALFFVPAFLVHVVSFLRQKLFFPLSCPAQHYFIQKILFSRGEHEGGTRTDGLHSLYV
jgi:hypothetical protein